MDSNPLSKQDSIELFGEFLEVAIHTILYVRNVYPEGNQIKFQFLNFEF